MRTYHTRKQIIEAIKYWQKRLDESKSSLLDAFSKEFGEDVVFGNAGYERINASLDMIKRIYRISNDIIFNSALTLRDIKLMHGNCQSFASYVYAKARSHGKLVYVNQMYVAKDGNTYYPPYIEIRSYVLSVKMPFMFLASIVIHEMIHQYTVEHGNELMHEDDDANIGKEHNPHGEEFMKIANDINEEHGTSIEEKCNICAIKQEFDDAIAAARKMQESENGKNIVYSNEYLVVEKPGEEEIYVVHMY